jgi:tRNA nucleotidyltransferase (CCA-adding enzyme)
MGGSGHNPESPVAFLVSTIRHAVVSEQWNDNRQMTPRRAAQPLLKRLPPKVATLLRDLGRLADEQGVGLYLVGGVVRDLVLKRSNWDLDLTVEGDGMGFSRLVTDRYKAGSALFERFATARLILPDGLKVDIASTRRESYINPAALPDVRPASLEEDLFRRDFTINAMALQLNVTRWGELCDPYGGQQDLQRKTIRVLHNRSFVDDPTRIFRAIRFAERFGFCLEPNTGRLLARAASTNLVDRLSGSRLGNEIFALMKERHPEVSIGRLRRLRLLRFLHPRLVPGKRTERLLAALPQAIGSWRRQCPDAPLDLSLLWVMALLAHMNASVISGTIQRLQLSAVQAGALEWAGEKTSRIAKTLSGDALLRPSQIYHLLARVPDEALALALAKGLITNSGAAIGRLTRRLIRFIKRDRHAKTTTNGDTLKELGLQPGPHFKKILDRLLDERLDGRITAAAEERDRARILAKQYG